MNQTNPKLSILRHSAVLLGALTCLACSDDDSGSGDLSVIIEAEDVIVQGLEAGDESENIADGWNVDFENYIAALGPVELFDSSDQDQEEHADEVYVVDLVEIPASGLELWTMDSISSGRWDFEYESPIATDDAIRHESVDKDDYELLVEGEWTYLIRGTMEKEDGESCPPEDLVDSPKKETNGNTSSGNDCYDAETISFEISSAAETRFGPCEADGIGGVSVPSGGSQTAAITIHGDHLFFNGFPEGSEGGITRLAQWLADCDLNLDGMVTNEELEQIRPSDLPELDDRFQFGGSPITPIETMLEYVEAQLKTQGHFQGEGECPVDGISHEHEEDEEDEEPDDKH